MYLTGGGRKGADRMNVYLGNLNQDATQEDIEELVSEFSPIEVRMKKMGTDPRKVFAFVEFSSSSEDKADEMIEKLNNQIWMGRKLLVRLAHENREKREAASNTGNNYNASAEKKSSKHSTEKKPSKPNWGQSSNSGTSNNSNNTNNAVSSLDDDEWDNDTEDKAYSQQSVTADETKKSMSSIWATPNTNDNTGARSPLKSPILDQSYTQTAASPVKSFSPIKTGPQINSAYGQNQPLASQTFTKSPVKTEQDLLVESMTSFLKSPEKPQVPQEMHRTVEASVTNENQYIRSPVKTDTGMQITIQQSPHKRNLNDVFSQLEMSNDGSSTMQKLSPKINKNPVQQCNGSANAVLPEDDFDDMPVLEPSVGDPMPPLVPSVKKSSKVFVSNFPYGSYDEELYRLFYDYGVMDINVRNRNMTSKSTTAIITLKSPELAEVAIANLNQTQYMGRRLLVTGAKTTEEVRRDCQTHGYNQGYSSEQQRNHDRYHHQQQNYPQRRYNGYSKRFPQQGSYSSEEFNQGLLWISCLILTSNTTLEKLEDVMKALQLDETRTGPTKGLGRCAAIYDNEWYRGWIIAEKGFNLTVFYVDYGNIATIPKNATRLTCPDLWEHKPALRPFKLTEGSAIDLKQLESKVVTLQVVQTGIEDTGYLIEVIVTSQA
ncbi:hypothetical protein KUTeg_018225 [Tegillarca granosa]|uniref:Uncharacterized protein n=1 Tax=Tegillarca granosa TaxID=220873 RepID=A0ABQ9EH84_TEGGR|nr:hypothetical protein KUTeg_018225 [Tegillarca granosa]